MTRKIPDDAFEYYIGLGPQRSYKTVAEHYGATKRAVTKHAVRERWSHRLTQIERAVREKSDEQIADELREMRHRHLGTLRAMHSRALTALKQFPLNSGMEAMRAAEMVIKLERLIVGEPSERAEVSIEEISKREIQQLLVVKPVGPDEAE